MVVSLKRPKLKTMTEQKFKEIIKESDSLEKRLVFVQKFLFHGIPEVFKNREEDYFEFRNRIVNKFNVGFHEVFIVGSAKLGFSYFKGTQFNLEQVEIQNAVYDGEFINTAKKY